MRMRTKLPIVTMVGAGALLLYALAVIFTLRGQTAYASVRPPHGDIGLVTRMWRFLDSGAETTRGDTGENLQCLAFSSTICPAMAQKYKPEDHGDGDCDYNDEFHQRPIQVRGLSSK